MHCVVFVFCTYDLNIKILHCITDLKILRAAVM